MRATERGGVEGEAGRGSERGGEAGRGGERGREGGREGERERDRETETERERETIGTPFIRSTFVKVQKRPAYLVKEA